MAQGRPVSEQIDEQQSGQEPDPTEYLSVEETAERLKFARRTIRSWCQWGWFVGVQKSSEGWRIPVGSLDGALKHVRVYHATKTKAVQVAESIGDAEKVGD